MTIKQKFERIDQTKLEPKQVDALKIVLDFTENFKTKDKEKIKITNEKLDTIIGKLQEKNPDAIKSIPSAKTSTKKAVKPKTPKRNIFSVAKEIKKVGETFEEAKVRASKMIKQEKEEANKTIKTEMQSLLEYIKEHKELQGIHGTDLGRDASRVAKVGGRRISKDGNVYYENRENRKDRLAPNYPKNAPLLAMGGGVEDKYRGTIIDDSIEYIVKQLPYRYQIKDDSLGLSVISTKEGLVSLKNLLHFKYGIDSSFDDSDKMGLKELKITSGQTVGDFFENGGNVVNKKYEIKHNIGKSKYVVSYNDGIKKHKDGSDFYDIKIFKNKKDLENFVSKLSKDGYNKFENGGEFMTDPTFGNFQNQVYAKGGLLPAKERYMLEIKGQTGLRITAIENYIEENNLTDDDILNIVVGLGRRQLKGSDVATAVVGKKGNTESKKLIAFAKSNGGMKMANGGEFMTDPTFGNFQSGVYARGGHVSKGELVWRKLSSSDRSDFLYKNFTPEITPRSQELLVGKDFNFLPKNVKIKIEAKYANVEEYAKGGELKDFSDNQLMIMNQNVELEHHHEELEDILEYKNEVPAWVVAKMATATQSISDVTHYLDGEKELLEEGNEEDEDEDEVTVKPMSISTGIKSNLVKDFSEDALGNLKGFLKGKEGIELEDDYTFSYKGKKFEIEPVINSDEKGVSNALFTVYDNNDEQVGEIIYTRGNGKQNFKANSKLFKWDNTKFELGGVMVTDLAGHTGGSLGTGDPTLLSGYSGTYYGGLTGETGAMSAGEMFEVGGTLSDPAILNAYSGTRYTGLVAETGALSSGEMFEMGGGLPDGVQQSYVNYYLGATGVLAEGGSLEAHGIKEGDTFIKTIAGNIQKVKDKDGKIVFINLANGERDSQPPLPFKKGGSVDHKYLNHSQDYEVRYAKGKNRHGYGHIEYAKGGETEFSEKRKEYLQNLGNLEAEVWDKIGAKSGGEIRSDKTLLKEYAQGVSKIMETEGVGYGSFDQNDYDYYTDENWHLFNEFLVWNNYYEPEITKVQKAWRLEYFKNPKKSMYVSNPEVITLNSTKRTNEQEVSSNSSKPIAKLIPNLKKHYISHNEIETVTVKKGGKEVTYDAKDVLNGANMLEKGGQVEKIANYISKNNVVHVELKDGTHVKPSNGYWIKKGATPIGKMAEGGNLDKVKWQDVEKGDSARVKDDNKMGLVVKNYGRKFHLKFPNGTEKTFDASDLEFFKLEKDEYEMDDDYNYKEGGKIEEAIINKDGIRVRSVSQPKKKLTEAEWLAKHSESKEARSYKSGGNLSKYSEFIQDEFASSKRLANKFAKKYNLPFLVLVEKDNDDEIYVKEAYGFYAFPKSYIDAHDVLYVTDEKLPTPENMKMADGGKVTFKKKSSAIAKKFVGKRVEPKYQKEYGKVYSKKEASEVGNKIVGSMVAGEKMKKGGIANRGGIMLLAKQIRKENESWKDALKRAGEELKK